MENMNNEIVRKAIEWQVENYETCPFASGIFIYYHDHLNWDAYSVKVRSYYRNYVALFPDVNMWTDSDYYGFKGLKSVVNKLHELYPKYPIVWVDCAWYTFAGKYSFDVEVPDYMKEEWPDIKTFHIEKPSNYIEDSQN